MCNFIDQINLSSKCAKPSCSGKLKLVSVSMIGQQGCVTLQYDCTGCAERRVTFNSSIKHETENCTAVGLALQVAFICSGAMYSQYAKVLKNCLGMYCAGKSIYYRTLALMYPHVKGILDDMCEQAKETMKQKNDSELGSFKNAVTCGDAAWLTRGYHSQNATYTLRNFQTGGLLYYKHFSQRGKDDITGEELFEGTSKSAEGFGAEWVFQKAVTDKMNISIHVQDNDSTSSKALLSNFPNCRIILCSGHIARNHEKHLKRLAKQKIFTKSQIKKYEKTHPGITTVKCHCMKDDIGCFTNGFIKAARINFSAIVKSVGCDQDAFSNRLHSLAKYHAKNVHEWDSGKCFFHDLTDCDCGKCTKGNITCQGKPYKTNNILSCPFHSLAYEIACEAVIAKSKQIIHEELGSCHTSIIESSHNVLLQFRSKNLNLQMLHYYVSTSLGLIQSNMSWMCVHKGPAYHWLLDLFDRMSLPRFDGMAEALKALNVSRFKSLSKVKQCDVKRKRRRAGKRHRQSEQTARKLWVEQQKSCHTYGKETPKSSRKRKAKQDESTIYRGKKGKLSMTDVNQDIGTQRLSFVHDSGGVKDDKVADLQVSLLSVDSDDDRSFASSYDSSILNSSDIDSDLEEFIINSVKCTCSIEKSSHQRSCPLNPRNSGKSAEEEHDVEFVKADDAKPFAIGKTPSIDWMNSAALLIQDYTGETVSVDTDPLKTIKHAGISPYICHKIKGDGNCFYRAISKAVTGTERNHMLVRLTLCAFMTNNALELSNLILPHVHDIISKNAVTAMKAHILKKKLDQFGTWASENEIFIAATVFQLKIHVSVLSNHKGSRSWNTFKSQFHNKSCHYLSDFNVYLFHTNGMNHYDLIDFNLT